MSGNGPFLPGAASTGARRTSFASSRVVISTRVGSADGEVPNVTIAITTAMPKPARSFDPEKIVLPDTPSGAVHIRLSTRDVFDMSCVGQNQCEITSLRMFQTGFQEKHHDVGCPEQCEPIRQGEQVARRGLEGAHLTDDFAFMRRVQATLELSR